MNKTFENEYILTKKLIKDYVYNILYKKMIINDGIIVKNRIKNTKFSFEIFPPKKQGADIEFL